MLELKNFEEAKKCYNKFDNTVCVSKWVMDYFSKTFEFQKPIQVLYNTIVTDKILEKSVEPVDDIKIDDDCVNICSVGKLTAVKGFDRLLNIHKKLLDDVVKNKVYLFGIGEEEVDGVLFGDLRPEASECARPTADDEILIGRRSEAQRATEEKEKDRSANHNPSPK